MIVQKRNAVIIRSIFLVYSFLICIVRSGSKNKTPEIIAKTGTHHLTLLSAILLTCQLKVKISEEYMTFEAVCIRITPTVAKILRTSRYMICSSFTLYLSKMFFPHSAKMISASVLLIFKHNYSMIMTDRQ